VINGQSDWIAPGELHLGLTLAELEKLNGKPFKLSGFDKDHVATLSDWDGGTLSALAGGCKVGISLHADPKAAAATLSGLPADRAFPSSDASLRATNPTVSEILVGYWKRFFTLRKRGCGAGSVGDASLLVSRSPWTPL